ncbi:hypothetical protein NPIL_69851 [Nephila pilipes]|uniref:Uncharacterized protein n=1 Tax=Nephila pilipes TaxID=299642 RepID=A0A8X6U6I9_NEPPI|nr:hypothetical protein NPIL_69851 [Nephila pilipes]
MKRENLMVYREKNSSYGNLSINFKIEPLFAMFIRSRDGVLNSEGAVIWLLKLNMKKAICVLFINESF